MQIKKKYHAKNKDYKKTPKNRSTVTVQGECGKSRTPGSRKTHLLLLPLLWWTFLLLWRISLPPNPECWGSLSTLNLKRSKRRWHHTCPHAFNRHVETCPMPKTVNGYAYEMRTQHKLISCLDLSPFPKITHYYIYRGILKCEKFQFWNYSSPEHFR